MSVMRLVLARRGDLYPAEPKVLGTAIRRQPELKLLRLAIGCRRHLVGATSGGDGNVSGRPLA